MRSDIMCINDVNEIMIEMFHFVTAVLLS